MWRKIRGFYKKRALNLPLIIGTVILALLLFASIYPEYVYPADPFGIQRLQYNNEDNASEFYTPPIPPSKDYPWGTDELGRDMKSLIIYGTKQTIFIACLAALLRLIIALPIAIMAGYQNKTALRLIKFFNTIFSAIPLAIAVLIFSSIGIFNFLIEDSVVRSIVWVALLGWSRLAHLLAEKVREILAQDFIEGEVAIGKNRFEIAAENILPHLIPSMVVMYFLEIAMVLLLQIQIGVLSTAFGGGYYNAEGDRAVPVEFDWSSLLQSAYLLFGGTKMWLVTYPAAAFAVAVIGFNLFGEGLRLEFDKRNSKVITFIKKIPGFFSLPKLIYELKSYKEYRRNLTTKAAVYIVILAILFTPPFPSRYRFNAEQSMAIVKELSDAKYQGRRTGTEGAKLTAEYIADKLKSYGVKPYGEEYIQSFDVPVVHNIKNAELKVYTSSGREIKLAHRNDFIVQTPTNIHERLSVIQVTPKDFDELDEERLSKYRDSMLLLDIRSIDYRELFGLMSFLSRFIQPKALMMINYWGGDDSYYKGLSIDKEFDNTSVIMLSVEKGDELLAYKDLVAEYIVEADTYHNTKGYNVVGYIPGSNPKYEKECIVIGSAIDHVGDDKNTRYPGSMSASAVATQLEIARVMSKYGLKPEKTIIFGFWDGSLTDYRGSKDFKLRYINEKSLQTFYIELTDMAAKDSGKIMLDTSKTIPKSKITQTYIKAFKAIARAKDVPVVYSKLITPAMDDFLGYGKEALMFGSDGVKDYLNTPDDNYSLINKEKLGQYGQVILDTIIRIAQK